MKDTESTRNGIPKEIHEDKQLLIDLVYRILCTDLTFSLKYSIMYFAFMCIFVKCDLDHRIILLENFSQLYHLLNSNIREQKMHLNGRELQISDCIVTFPFHELVIFAFISFDFSRVSDKNERLTYFFMQLLVCFLFTVRCNIVLPLISYSLLTKRKK